MSIFLKATDEELFEDLMQDMEDRDEREREEHPEEFNPLEIITGWIEKDAPRIALKGETTYSVTQGRRNVLRATDPESKWYGIGYRWWHEYCDRLIQKVSTLKPARLVKMDSFPSW